MEKKHRSRPEHVLRAILADDTPTLRELGRRGNQSPKRKLARAQKRLNLNPKPKVRRQKTTMKEIIETCRLYGSYDMMTEAQEFDVPLV